MKTKLLFLRRNIFLFLLMFNSFAFSQTVLNESFTGATLPAGWQNVSASGITDYHTWTFYDAYDDVEVYEKNGVAQNELLISPTLDLSNLSNAYINFSLWLYSRNSFIANNTSDVKVMVSKDNAAFVPIFSDAELDITDFNNSNYFFYRNIPKSLATYCGPGNNNIRIGFLFTSTGTGSNFGGQAYLMDVKVSTDCPTPAPRTFTGSGITWFPIDNFSGTFDLKLTENGVDTIISGLTGTSYNFANTKCGYSVAIRANCGGTTGAWSEVGNSFDTRVSNVQNTFGPNSNTISWTGTASSYDIEYGPKGFTLGSGILVSGITANSYTINGLFACQDYQYYVRTNCGNGSVGSWSTQSFTMPTTASQSPLTPTFTEQFNGKLCEIGYLSYAGINNSGPNVSNTLQMLTNPSNRNSRVVTRGVNLVAGVPVNINFSAMKASSNSLYSYPYLRVGTTNNPNSHSTIVGLIIPSSNTFYSFMSFNYIPTTTGVHYFSFDITGSSNATEGIIVDNFKINSCVAYNSSTTNITYNSATINVAKNCDTYDLEYGPFGFTPGNGIKITDLTSPTYQINNLLPCSSYTVYITPKCGGTASDTTSTNFSTTYSASATNIPYFVDFSSTPCQSQWDRPLQMTFSNGEMIFCANSTGIVTYTRGLNLVAGKTYLLSFKHKNMNTGGSTNIRFSVGNTKDIAAQTEIKNFSYPMVTTAETSFSTSSTEFTVPASGVYYIGIKMSYSNNTCSVFNIDDFQIQDKLLSTNENTQEKVTVYPNPVKETLYIKSKEKIEAITIYDLSGKLILDNQKVTDNKIDVSKLNSGVYTIIFKTKNSSINSKFIKK